jgi:hypothetical protein
MTRFLHVANGTSTTRTIQAAGISGACSLWADVLYEGPVPAGVSDDELLELRMRFLGGPLDFDSDHPEDPTNDLREWRRAIERHECYDELILWFEHDLFDQLNLIQLLTWIRDHLRATKTVSLICIGSFPGRPDFKGLGELTPDELAPLLGTRQPVSDSQYDLARRAWNAFREPTPEPLDALRHEEMKALPFLPSALTRFLQEYPSTSDGLSRTERRLLQLAAAGGMSLSRGFRRMHEGERAYHVTDGTLLSIAEDFRSTSPPLLSMDSHAAATRLFEAPIALTETGRSVLNGQVDRIAACGIDRWLGGVHLQGGSVRWRWDDASQRVVRSER